MEASEVRDRPLGGDEMARACGQAWSLGDGETILWEGAQAPAALQAERAMAFRLASLAAVVSIAMAGAIAWHIGSSGDIVVKPADPSLGEFVAMAAETLRDSFLVGLVNGVVLPAVIAAIVLAACRRASSTRYAVTTRRLLARRGKRPPDAFAISDISDILPCAPDRNGLVDVWVAFHSDAAVQANSRLGRRKLLGKFQVSDARALDIALLLALGRRHGDCAADAAACRHSFPGWMKPLERAKVASMLPTGERLLWCGRPAGTVPGLCWLLWAVALGFVACGLHELIAGDDSVLAIRGFIKAERVLFTNVGGCAGVTMGVVLGLFWVVFDFGLAMVAGWPLWERIGRRRTRYFVSNRRVWTQYARASGGSVVRLHDIREIVAPVVRRTAAGKSNVFFIPLGGKTLCGDGASIWNADGFLDLPDSDVPMACASIESVRSRG